MMKAWARSVWLVLLSLAQPWLFAADGELADRANGAFAAVACSVDAQGKGAEGGSGIVVGDGSWVITNLHVFTKDSAGGCFVAGPRVKSHAQVVDGSKELDVLLLKLDTPARGPAAEFAPVSTISEGEPILSVGMGGEGGGPAASKGTVSGLKRVSENAAIIKTTLKFDQNNTGGPILTACGTVVGMGNDKAPEGVALAIESVVPLLQKHGIRAAMASSQCRGGSDSDEPKTDEPDQPAQRRGNPAPDGRRTNAHDNTVLWVLAGVAAVIVFGSMNKRSRQMAHEAYQTVSYRSSRRSAGPVHDSSPQLVCVAGPLAGARFRLTSAPSVIGRDPACCQIVLPAQTPGVSRRHCSIRMGSDGLMVLEDCNSSNGTFLATGERLEAGRPLRIRPGESFHLGTRSVVFEVSAANEC